MSKNNVYTALYTITEKYLGPSTNRFLDRHIESHLQIKPEKITNRQLSELIKWLKISFSLLTNDKLIVSKYLDEIKKIGRLK